MNVTRNRLTDLENKLMVISKVREWQKGKIEVLRDTKY